MLARRRRSYRTRSFCVIKAPSISMYWKSSPPGTTIGAEPLDHAIGGTFLTAVAPLWSDVRPFIIGPVDFWEVAGPTSKIGPLLRTPQRQRSSQNGLSESPIASCEAARFSRIHLIVRRYAENWCPRNRPGHDRTGSRRSGRYTTDAGASSMEYSGWNRDCRSGRDRGVSAVSRCSSPLRSIQTL